MISPVIWANDKESITHKVTLVQAIRPWMKVGAHVEAGEKITEGQVDPKELLKVAGVRQVQNYIQKEVKKVYASQGIEISDKHIEVMIRQMHQPSSKDELPVPKSPYA